MPSIVNFNPFTNISGYCDASPLVKDLSLLIPLSRINQFCSDSFPENGANKF